MISTESLYGIFGFFFGMVIILLLWIDYLLNPEVYNK